MYSDVLRSDIYSVLSDGNIPWDRFKNSVVLVTGATGLVGGALVRTLSAANKQYGLNMRLIAHGRDKDKGAALTEEWGSEFVGGDIRYLTSLSAITERITFIFHCASITKSADMAAKPVDVMTTAVDGTRNMIELAIAKQCEGFVYLSSMEVYGQTDLKELCEKDLGYLDLSNPRSSYPESKRFCEMLCVSYAKQNNAPIVIARLAQTFGAGTPKDDSRVFAQFAKSAIAGKDIELHTTGESRGNYCYISDSIRGLLTILLKGKPREAYNIANPVASATILEMADIVAGEVCEGKIKVAVNIPEDIASRGYAPDVGYTLNIEKLTALGWRPQYGLAEMYKRLIADWRAS